MELSLNFSDDDFSSKSKKVESEQEREEYRIKQCESQWYADCKDAAQTKFAADNAYLLGDFEMAVSLYSTLLDSSERGWSFRRDALESIARAHIKLKQYEKAREFANKLLSSGNRKNTDHASSCLNLLASCYHGERDLQSEIGSLCLLIELHPFMPDFWIRLGKAYRSCEENELRSNPISSSSKTQVVAFCLVRALILLQGVSRTVKSFAKAKNEKLIEDLTGQLKEQRLTSEESDRIRLFASMDIYQREMDENLDDVKAGASESKDSCSDVDPRCADETIDNLSAVCDFEKKWFSFCKE